MSDFHIYFELEFAVRMEFRRIIIFGLKLRYTEYYRPL